MLWEKTGIVEHSIKSKEHAIDKLVYFAHTSETESAMSSTYKQYSQITFFLPVKRNTTHILANDFLITSLLSICSFGVVFLKEESAADKMELLFTLCIALSAERLRLSSSLPKDAGMFSWTFLVNLLMISNVFITIVVVLWEGENPPSAIHKRVWAAVYSCLLLFAIVRGYVYLRHQSQLARQLSYECSQAGEDAIREAEERITLTEGASVQARNRAKSNSLQFANKAGGDEKEAPVPVLSDSGSSSGLQ